MESTFGKTIFTSNGKVAAAIISASIGIVLMGVLTFTRKSLTDTLAIWEPIAVPQYLEPVLKEVFIRESQYRLKISLLSGNGKVIIEDIFPPGEKNINRPVSIYYREIEPQKRIKKRGQIIGSMDNVVTTVFKPFHILQLSA